ncbi:MAG: conjugal transfer protein TraG [Parvularculaceae bacterium]
MTPTRILIGQAIIVVLIIAAAMQLATQYVAGSFGFDPALGNSWSHIGETPIYFPWRLFDWWYAYEAYAPDIFMQGGAIAAAGGMIGAVAAVAGSLWRARQQRNVTTYGSARWARRRDIEHAGLFEPDGVFLGRWRGDYLRHAYLRHDGPEHVMAFAPTRSGKGVGLVVPTLLSWTGSAVIHDIKGENWALTSGWRSKFSHCLLFDPTDAGSARYNPLLEVRKGAGEVRDVQNIADILVDPEGSLERRSHWEKTGHALLVGVILHVLYAEEEKTLARVASFLSDPSRTFEKTLGLMKATNHLGTKRAPKVHPVVAQVARELLNKSENERSGVLSTAMSFLSLYRDPTIAAVTASCDWRIADLIEAEHPVSLYLVVPPSDISRTKPLIRLVLNQIGRRLTEELESASSAKRHKLLMMLDEFPALGRLDFFESALAFMAGYGVRAYLIAQSLNQIEKAYGPNNSILDNCHVRVAFAANDERTAKRISDALGTATELRAQRNYAGHRLAPWLAHVMVSRQETARPLLTPGEAMQLPADEAIVMVAGSPPIRAKKLQYYKDRNFTVRRLAPVKIDPEGGAYPDAPAPRADDWIGVTAKFELLLAIEDEDEAKAPIAADESGLQQAPALDPKPQPRGVTADREPAHQEDNDDLADARRLERLILDTARRAGLDRGDGMLDGVWSS